MKLNRTEKKVTMKTHKTLKDFTDIDNQQNLRERLITIMRKEHMVLSVMAKETKMTRDTLTTFLDGNDVTYPTLIRLEEFILHYE